MTATPCSHLRVKVMADYGTTGLWCEDCGALEHEDLALTEDLSARIVRWVATYDGLIDAWIATHSHLPAPPDFSAPPLATRDALRKFNAEGFAMACEIKELVRDSSRALYYWIE